MVQLFFKNFFVLTFCLFFLVGCDEFKKAQDSTKFSTLICSVDCDGFSEIDKKHYHDFSDGESIKVSLGKVVLNAESGKKVVLVSKKNPYGLTAKIEEPQENAFYKISILRKDISKKAVLVIQAENPSILYHTEKQGKPAANGWEKLETSFEVPPHTGKISIFCWITEGDSAYFDELEIKRLPSKIYNKHDSSKSIGLYFTDKKVQNFEEAKSIAFAEGVHFGDGNWHKGILSFEKGPIPIKAKFKGDWLDHLVGNKWSFRIKTRKGSTFKRMKQFSVQTPESRYFLHEYLAHQLFFEEGLLTTRYDFAPLYFNQTSRGVFAIEEHFTKQLIEYNLRREGPILKFDENPMWRGIAIHKGLEPVSGWKSHPNYETSRILAFGSSQISDNEAFKEKFLIGHSLLYQFKNRLAPVDDLFEIDKLAKYLALTDLHQGKHGAIWHNLRFYYNPISCKLEIINYDNFTPNYASHENDKTTALDFEQVTEKFKYKHFYTYFFTSPNLRTAYLKELKKVTDDSYLNTFYDRIEPQLNEFKKLIKIEFPEYDIDRDFLLSNAKSLRNDVKVIKKRHKDGFYDSLTIIDHDEQFSFDYFPSLFPHFLNAYYHLDNKTGKLLIENNNVTGIVPTRLFNKFKTLYRFEDSEVIRKYGEEGQNKEYILPYYKEATHLEFKDVDSNQIYNAEITPWQKNTALSPYQELKASSTSNPLQLFSKQNDTFLLTAGKYELRNKIIVPQGKIVVIEQGTELNILNNASIISYSSVHFLGTAESAILVTSSDKTANGIIVLQATNKSSVHHTTFKNLNTFSYKGWNLSGAVNFYESDVVISNSSFEGNLCEDALNIIKSNFLVDSCKFSNIFADAFDSDYCTGTLSNSSFNYVGNDAIDFSASQIKIQNCTIKNIDDKGISGGEGSTLWVKNCVIDGCQIGAASKDLSEVYLDSVVISNSKYGLVSLMKKPEYGAATIVAKNLKLENCQENLLIEKKSTVEINGMKIEGKQKKVAEMFY